MVTVLPFQAGDLCGNTFVFERAGDEVPPHWHDPATIHITIVRAGRIRLTGRPQIEGVILSAGEMVDWEPYELHGFIAETDGARVDNIRKYFRADPAASQIQGVGPADVG